EVADWPEIEGLGWRIGRAPVDMAVHAALILRVRVDEIVGEACGNRQLEPRLAQEGVSEPAIERPMSEPQASDTVGIVGANGHARHDVRHEVVRPDGPFE